MSGTATSFLAALDQPEQKVLIQQCTRHRYPAGAFVFHAGEAGDSLHILAKGKVMVLAGGSMGEQFALSILLPGDVFGELALLGQQPIRVATVQAFEPTETLVLRKAQFDELRHAQPMISEFLLHLLAKKLSDITNQLTEIVELPATVRIYRQIVRLGVIFGATAPGTTIKVMQHQVASLAGVRLRVANQVIGAAKREHLLETTKGRITIMDWTGLVDRSGLKNQTP